MIFASKSTLSLNNFKILRPNVMKNLTNLRKKFSEFPPSTLRICYKILKKLYEGFKTKLGEKDF